MIQQQKAQKLIQSVIGGLDAHDFDEQIEAGAQSGGPEGQGVLMNMVARVGEQGSHEVSLIMIVRRTPEEEKQIAAPDQRVVDTNGNPINGTH